MGKQKKDRRAGTKKSAYTAATADKYELYQLSVQSPQEDVEFLASTYKQIRGQNAYHFREDFCGTGLLSATWITQDKKRTAEGFDIDPEPVDWGRTHHFASLGGSAKRMTFHLQDVRKPSDTPPDVRCAQNFSYWIFKTRSELLDYFQNAREDLAENGIFVIDLHGGPEVMEEMTEETEIGAGFTYIWDQDEYWPVTSEVLMHIHFRFPDGTELNRAFTYDWRLWSLTELKEVLLDAGFEQVYCYWEGTADDEESGDGNFAREDKGERCLSYIAYLVAQK